METTAISTRCCIAGGGPAGIMLGYLLARSGVDVVVLEKHADFLRDFRGDTVHPSTMEVFYELGILDAFLARPHQEVTAFAGRVGDVDVPIADFSHMPTHCKFLAFMPQWDFLNFITEEAKRFPAFQLKMQTEVVDLIREGDRVVGVSATTPAGQLDVRADLVVASDGRASIVREKAGLEIIDFGAPMDALWMRISRDPADRATIFGYVRDGKILVMFDRGDYWQCAFIIPKGSMMQLRARGLPSFREDIVRIVPFLSSRVDELRDWDDIKLLTVQVDRLRRWFILGLLCIGDAAHAMSPIGGVGINLALQDAIAAANVLAAPLRARAVGPKHLQAIQRRREFPARATQRMQLIIQNRIIRTVLQSDATPAIPFPIRMLQRWPLLRRIPAYLVGVGFRPEHVRTKEVTAAPLR
jgi:2-polyprenyl-6-methoxyphenol hydroxylase-like FAD-dependent oxidoreductase